MDRSKRGNAPKASWGKRIAIFFGVVVLLIAAAFFVATSSWFIKAVVLPKAGVALNAKVTAESVSLSPFSQLQLKGLRVETTGVEPLLTAQEVRVRYGLLDILKGNIRVDEITLSSPVVQIVQEPDGTSNLDPILNSEKKSDPDSKSREPTKLSIQNVSLKNGTIRQIQKLTGGGSKMTEVQALEISLDRLGNGQSGKLTVAATLNMEQKSGATNDVLRGTVSGGYQISLNQDLLPQTVTGSTKLDIASGQGAYSDLAGFNGTLEADVTPKELRRVALVFTKNNQRLGEIRASGPLDMDRREGTLRLEILSLDKNALALITAGQGMDFGQSQINSTNQVTISQGGTFFAASGNLNGGRISVKQGEMTTPEMNLNLDYQAMINTAEKSAVLQKLELAGNYGGKQFLRTELDRQMTLSWGATVKGYKDAALNLIVTNFNLADWRPIVGTNLSAGILQAGVSLIAQQDGKLLKTQVTAKIQGLSATFGTNRIQNSDLSLDVSGTVEQLKILNLTRYAFVLAEGAKEILQGNGALRYELESKDATLQLTARGDLPRLLAFAPMSGTAASEGRVEVSANFSESAGKRRAQGGVTLANFTGTYDAYRFQKFQVILEYNLEMDAKKMEMHRVSATFSQEFNSGGSIDLKGRYDLADKAGQFTFRAVDLNQHAFQPILAPSLGDNQLVSISLNSSGEATLDPKGETAVKATVKLANWVVKDPAGKLPLSPLAADLNVDAGMRAQAIDLRAFDLKLSPTARAKNELQLQGKLDLAQTNPAPSTLALRAESLDLTPYYEMFAGGTNAPPSAQAPTNAPAGDEPPPMALPFQQLAATLKIDRLYLREMAISNWTGQVTMRSNVLQLNPFKFDLNGGTMALTGSVDTSTPGYRYDIGFQAGNVPLLPLANTFGSGISNGLDGMFIADARITGAGVTGPNLRKNLGGHLTYSLTNLNYELVGPKLRRIIVPISIALGVPELTQTPLNWASARADIGKGIIDFKQFGVQSEAFFAESAGPIVLADVLTNSTLNFPLEISLRRSLAEKARIMPSDTPTNAKYAKLPKFVTVNGTVGAPETDINKLALAGILARGAAGLGLTFGNEKAGQVLGTVGNLLTGQRSATNAASTDPSSTNASVVGTALRNLGGLFGGAAATNAAAKTNTPATNAPPRASPLDLLRMLPRKQTN